MTRYRSVVWFGEKHAGDERLGEAQGEAEAIDHGYLASTRESTHEGEDRKRMVVKVKIGNTKRWCVSFL